MSKVTLEGYYAHVDGYGRVYFDKCKTDGEHLLAPTLPGEERRRCRTYIDNLLPPDSVGKKGTFTVSIEFTPEEG